MSGSSYVGNRGRASSMETEAPTRLYNYRLRRNDPGGIFLQKVEMDREKEGK